MKDFLKGLWALPFVVIGGFAIYWVGAILFAVIGGIIGFVVVLTPYVLRFVGIVLIVVLAIWGLGKLVTCAQSGAKNASKMISSIRPLSRRRGFFDIICAYELSDPHYGRPRPCRGGALRGRAEDHLRHRHVHGLR